jgi:putative FmdB family regulatory protein
MPLYEFECRACGRRFEELVTASQKPLCPACGQPEPDRLLSNISPPPKMGLRGAEARRSDAVRLAREEQRQARRAERREREARG